MDKNKNGTQRRNSARPRRKSPPRRRLRELPYHPHHAEIRDFLPYGEYHTAVGDRVVHDRFYSPLWRLRPNGEIEPVDPDEWISNVVHHDIFRDRRDQLDWKALDRVKAAWGIRTW
jgi:hypothetical protein